MRGGKPRKGLRITGGAVKARKTKWQTKYEPQPTGWYISVWIGERKQYQPLLDLRFLRLRDAERAVAALTAAGLDCYAAMKRAGLERVKQVACEFLWW